jgi:HEAT repeat protein
VTARDAVPPSSTPPAAPQATQRATQRVTQRAQWLRDLDDVDAGVRTTAARGLGDERHDDVAGALRGAIARERDGAVRTVMVASLVRLAGDALLREVARALKSTDVAVVVGAARVLACTGDRRVVPNLLEAFRTDDVVVGAAVATALGALGDPVVVPWLVAAVEQGFCVEQGCRALGLIGDHRALPALRARASDDDASVRLAAREALHRFAEQDAAATQAPHEDEDRDDVDDDARGPRRER